MKKKNDKDKMKNPKYSVESSFQPVYYIISNASYQNSQPFKMAQKNILISPSPRTSTDSNIVIEGGSNQLPTNWGVGSDSQRGSNDPIRFSAADPNNLQVDKSLGKASNLQKSTRGKHKSQSQDEVKFFIRNSVLPVDNTSQPDIQMVAEDKIQEVTYNESITNETVFIEMPVHNKPAYRAKTFTTTIDKPLTSLPSVQKTLVKNIVVQDKFTTAERKAVPLQRLEYGLKMKTVGKENRYSSESLKLAKVILIQRWWKRIKYSGISAIKIQSVYRGYLLRKRLFGLLFDAGEIMNKLNLFEDKIYLFLRKKSFRHILKYTNYVKLSSLRSKFCQIIVGLYLKKRGVFYNKFYTNLKQLWSAKIIEEFIQEFYEKNKLIWYDQMIPLMITKFRPIFLRKPFQHLCAVTSKTYLLLAAFHIAEVQRKLATFRKKITDYKTIIKRIKWKEEAEIKKKKLLLQFMRGKSKRDSAALKFYCSQWRYISQRILLCRITSDREKTRAIKSMKLIRERFVNSRIRKCFSKWQKVFLRGSGLNFNNYYNGSAMVIKFVRKSYLPDFWSLYFMRSQQKILIIILRQLERSSKALLLLQFQKFREISRNILLSNQSRHKMLIYRNNTMKRVLTHISNKSKLFTLLTYFHRLNSLRINYNRTGRVIKKIGNGITLLRPTILKTFFRDFIQKLKKISCTNFLAKILLKKITRHWMNIWRINNRKYLRSAVLSKIIMKFDKNKVNTAFKEWKHILILLIGKNKNLKYALKSIIKIPHRITTKKQKESFSKWIAYKNRINKATVKFKQSVYNVIKKIFYHVFEEGAANKKRMGKLMLILSKKNRKSIVMNIKKAFDIWKLSFLTGQTINRKLYHLISKKQQKINENDQILIQGKFLKWRHAMDQRLFLKNLMESICVRYENDHLDLLFRFVRGWRRIVLLRKMSFNAAVIQRFLRKKVQIRNLSKNQKFAFLVSKIIKKIPYSTIFTYLKKVSKFTRFFQKQIVRIENRNSSHLKYYFNHWKKLSQVVKSFAATTIQRNFKSYRSQKKTFKCVTLTKLHKNLDSKNISSILTFFQQWKRQINKDIFNFKAKIIQRFIKKGISKKKNTSQLKKMLGKLSSYILVKSLMAVSRESNKYFKQKVLSRILFTSKVFSADSVNKHKKLVITKLKQHNNFKQKKATAIAKIYQVYIYKILNRMLLTLMRKLKDSILFESLQMIKLTAMSRVFSKSKYAYKEFREKRTCSPKSKKLLFSKRVAPAENHIPHTPSTKNFKRNHILLPKFFEFFLNIIMQKKRSFFSNLRQHQQLSVSLSYLVEVLNKILLRGKKSVFVILNYHMMISDDINPLKKSFRGFFLKMLTSFGKIFKRFSRLGYLIKLTLMQKRIATCNWLREIIKRWRFCIMLKTLSKRKMEMLYKNMHLFYLNLAEDLFGDRDQSMKFDLYEMAENLGGFDLIKKDDINKFTSGIKKVWKKYDFSSDSQDFLDFDDYYQIQTKSNLTANTQSMNTQEMTATASTSTRSKIRKEKEPPMCQKSKAMKSAFKKNVYELIDSDEENLKSSKMTNVTVNNSIRTRGYPLRNEFGMKDQDTLMTIQSKSPLSIKINSIVTDTLNKRKLNK